MGNISKIISILQNTTAAMAIARPIRALALAAIVLWGFFIYVLIAPKGGSKYPLGPGDKMNYAHIKEPLLESMRSLLQFSIEHC